MLTKQQICKLNDVEPTENVLKAMEEWGDRIYDRAFIIGFIVGVFVLSVIAALIKYLS